MRVHLWQSNVKGLLKDAARLAILTQEQLEYVLKTGLCPFDSSVTTRSPVPQKEGLQKA